MKAIEYLKANQRKEEHSFLDLARKAREDWPWQKYSYAIAIKSASRMAALGITQQQLAGKLGCTQQHISHLLKGQANMTLETIAKIESALNIDLIGHQGLLNFDTNATEPFA